MEIDQVTWSDPAAVRAFVDVVDAVRQADAPWARSTTESETVGYLRWGWDGDPTVAFLARVDGCVVGAAQYEVSTYDNHHLAWLSVDVLPAHRRRGHGSAILAALVDRARAEGRTSIGIGGWDSAAPEAFAARHGLEARSVEINRRQVLAEVDRASLDGLYDEARRHATAYELLRLRPPTAPADLAAMAEMVAAINDAPNDDLDYEDEVFTPERVAAMEAVQEARGNRLYRVVARHRETGELAGQSVVVVDGERPHLAEQDDTSVVRSHRGHRLGLLLKLEMLRWLAQAEPQVTEIDTWNAESNDHMVGVNELLGYRVLGRMIDYQRSLL